MKVLRACVLLSSLSLIAPGQVVAAPKPTVHAMGSATVNSTPDQATVSFAVETRAATAQDAASQNTTITNALIGALQGVLGSSGTVQTGGYSLTPLYTYPPNGGPGTLTGFSVTNSIQATINALSLIGKAIDAGWQAGATSVQSLTFSMKDPEPSRLQALKQATVLARSHAEAMAGGASLHLGNVISVVEGSTSTPVVFAAIAGAPAASTPILPGPMTTTATVTMDFELVP